MSTTHRGQLDPEFSGLDSSSDAPRFSAWLRNVRGTLQHFDELQALVAGGDPGPQNPGPADFRTDVVWLAQANAGDTSRGRGTANDPFRIRTAEEFDAIIGHHNIRHFRLYPGVYMTRGSWVWPRFCILPEGGSLIGAGRGRTIIRLSPNAAFEANGQKRPDANVLVVGAYHTNRGGWVISGLTIDGNYKAFSDPRLMIRNGLRIIGNAAHVSDVEVRGLRGCYDPHPTDGIQYEAFGISTINHESRTPEDWQGLDGGTVIRDCLVHECCPASYCSAISLGYRPMGRPIAPSIVERCVVRDFADNWFAFSACDNTTFRDCYASGMRHGFYNDTEGVDGWLIDHCEIHSRRTAIYICGLDSVPGHWRKCNVRATNSTFGWEYEKGTDKYVLSLWDKHEPSPDGFDWYSFEISGCRILDAPAPPEGAPPNEVVLTNTYAARLRDVRFTDNILPSNYRCLFRDPAPGDCVVLRDNRRPDGQPDLQFVHEDLSTVWLSPIESGTVLTFDTRTKPQKKHARLGRGTRNDPYRVATPDQLDALLRSHRHPVRLMLMPGEYRTRGSASSQPGPMLAPGSELIGVGGSAFTRMILDPSAVAASGPPGASPPVAALTGGIDPRESPEATSDHLRIEGLTIELPEASIRPTAGVHLRTAGAKLVDVVITNAWGRWNLSGPMKNGVAEGFGILLDDVQGNVRTGGHHLERCRVEMRRGAYATGIRIVTRQNAAIPSFVRQCRVIGNGGDRLDYSHCAFAANCSVTFRDCACDSVAYAMFGTSGPVDDILFDGCRLTASYSIVTFISPAPQPHSRVRIVHSNLDLLGGREDRVVLLQLTDRAGSTPFSDFRFVDCLIRAPLDEPVTRFYLVGLNGPETSRIVVSECTYPSYARCTAGDGLFTPCPKTALVLTGNILL